MNRPWRSLAALIGALVLAACGATQPTGPVTITLLPGSLPPASSGAPSGAPSGGPINTAGPTVSLGQATAEIELTITGGPAEGSYRAVVHGTSCIQPSPEQLVANYADATAADGFTALDLDVRDAPAAIDGESDDFALNVSASGSTYMVDPRAGQGEGTALLEIDPLANGTLDLFATAADGTEIELSLLCDVEAF